MVCALTHRIVLAAGLVIVAPSPRPGLAHQLAADTSATLYEVSNLKVIHQFNDASDVVVVRLYLLGGTRQVTDRDAGIELLLLKAAQLEHGHTIIRTGSKHILEASLDWTVTGFVGLREDLDSAWAGFARQLERPAYSDTAFERARGELMTGARRRYTEPDLRVHAGAKSLAFRGHPYARDPQGTEASLLSLAQTDLEHFWDREFVTSRMLLVVVGNVMQAKIDSLVTSTVGHLPAGLYHWTLPPPLPQRESHWIREHQLLPTNYILGYFGGPAPTDSDYFGFRLTVTLLSSVLHTRIREEESLGYAAYAPLLDAALPVGGIYVSTGSPDRAIRIMRRTLGEFRQDVEWGYEPVGWARYKDGFTLDALMERLTSDGQAETLARAYLYFGDLTMAGGFVDKLRRVNYWSLPDIAERYMQNIQWAYMGDTAKMRGRW